MQQTLSSQPRDCWATSLKARQRQCVINLVTDSQPDDHSQMTAAQLTCCQYLSANSRYERPSACHSRNPLMALNITDEPLQFQQGAGANRAPTVREGVARLQEEFGFRSTWPLEWVCCYISQQACKHKGVLREDIMDCVPLQSV